MTDAPLEVSFWVSLDEGVDWAYFSSAVASSAVAWLASRWLVLIGGLTANSAELGNCFLNMTFNL